MLTTMIVKVVVVFLVTVNTIVLSEDAVACGNSPPVSDRNRWYTMTTRHVAMDCKWNGAPICCALLDPNSTETNSQGRATTTTTPVPPAVQQVHPSTIATAAKLQAKALPTHTHISTHTISHGPHHIDTSIPSIPHGSLRGDSHTHYPQQHGHSRQLFSSYALPPPEPSTSSSSNEKHDPRSSSCKTTREYIPSPYETTHIAKATEIAAIDNLQQRKQLILQYIEQDVENTNHWLARVDFHMRDDRPAHEKYASTPHPDDLQYMSRFNVTTTCHGGVTHNWIEWIEPLSVHARHPNGLIEHCPVFKMMRPRVANRIQFHAPDLTSPDYILIQHNDDYHHTKLLGRHVAQNRKKYLFDAGSNYFNTGTAWFTCAYLQKGIDFDHIFTIEYEKLDPVEYFHAVPPKVIPFIHFMNVPASAHHDDSGSILRSLKQVVKEQDFVSFKLDIDTPDIEIPMFLEILRNDEYSSLIDEFFFELHFRCEFMAHCGWEDKMAAEIDGFKMERSSTMKAFQQLRQKGIRAHFWP